MYDNYTVYKHTSPKGKVYFGITRKKPSERWRNGFGYRTQTRFYRAIQKYGWDSFIHEILICGLSEKDAKSVEKALIFVRQSNDKRFGYNSTLGGDGCLGYSPPGEVREKLSQANKGKVRSAETRRRISESRVGIRPSEETRRKLSERRPDIRGSANPMYGKRHNLETRKKMSENRPKKSVIQTLSDGTFLCEYVSVREAERITGVDRSTIIRCCKNKQNTAGGFGWKYKEEQQCMTFKQSNLE